MKIALIILTIIFTSCSVERKPSFSEISGDNYTIQVTSLKMHGDESETAGYKISVLPTQRVSDEKRQQLQDSRWYQADGCFYITQGDTLIKPELVQLLGTGEINRYEFKVVFEGMQTRLNDELTMVFDDQYITKEKYFIKLMRKL